MPLSFLGGVFVGFESYFHAFESLTSTSAIVAFGLIFAVLGIGTSPAIALAIISETGAKGRLSELVLGIAVLKDLVVVVAMAIALAAAGSVLSGGGEGAHALLHVYDTGGFEGLASDIMSTDLRTVSADEDLARVLLLLTRGLVVPVIHDGKFQGLITKIDVLNHMRLAAG